MSLQQIELFAILGLVLGALLWGRFRHDLVAAAGLLLAVVLGLIPQAQAFSGFSHPAVLIVALVLVASRACENSGALAIVTRGLANPDRRLPLHVALLGGIGAALSAVINNVAALAMLMPVDIQTARKAGRSPRLTLMPLAFATILGGMITLIGTPPNIIVSAIRERELGEPYGMFDFMPVGLVVAIAGLAFVALIGWRLIPKTAREAAPVVEEQEFIADLVVTADSPTVGRVVGELDTVAEKAGVLIAGLVRGGRALAGRGHFTPIAADDVLLVEGPTDGIAEFIKEFRLQARDEAGPKADFPAETEGEAPMSADSFSVLEVVVRGEAPIAGATAESFRLRSRFDVTLLGISHQGETIRKRVRSHRIDPGDVLLMAGPHPALLRAAREIGVLSLNEVSAAPVRIWKVLVAIGLFAAAIVVASAGLLSFAVAIAIAVAGYAASGLVPAREFYHQIEWSVVVMLACLLPIGEAFDQVGGTALVADGLLRLTAGLPAVVSLLLLMLVTMTLSDVLNNVATIVIAGPLAITMAHRLDLNPDTFLMGTAIASSCAFLTPIGHKNNTLIMGPGGYAFRDYWRMGLPLELLVLAVAVPMLLFVWPL